MKAFTLIELLIVITIIAILAVAAHGAWVKMNEPKPLEVEAPRTQNTHPLLQNRD